MGKFTLIIVIGAIFGGTLLAYSTRGSWGQTEKMQRLSQGDLLAREAAAAGQSLVIRDMIRNNGNGLDPSDPSFEGTTIMLPGGVGSFTLGSYDYSASPVEEVTFRVIGRYTGADSVTAEHTIESTYEWDPFEFPCAICFDTPFVHASVAPSNPGAGFRSPADSALFSRRAFYDLEMGLIFNLENEVLRPLSDSLVLAEGRLRSPRSTTEAFEDLNVPDAAELRDRIFNILNSGPAESGDETILNPKLMGDCVTNDKNGGSTSKIVRFSGGLIIGPGSCLKGQGVLLIDNGNLRVLRDSTGDGELYWNGLVMVSSPTSGRLSDSLYVTLDGIVDITGGIVIAQRMAAPGGHVDITVHQDLTAPFWDRPFGDTTMLAGTPSDVYPPQVGSNPPTFSRADFSFPLPWYQHTHKYDSLTQILSIPSNPSGKRVDFFNYLLTNGTSHEDFTQFDAVLDAVKALGVDSIGLEFVNAAPARTANGDARYTLMVAGVTPTPIDTFVSTGFVDTPLVGTRPPYISDAFRTEDLQTLSLTVNSMRMLRELFDGQFSCNQSDSSPICLGHQRGRGGALGVRLRSAKEDSTFQDNSGIAFGQTLYEASIYWHMNATETSYYSAQRDSIRQNFREDGSMGTHFRMGPDVTIRYNSEQSIENSGIRERLLFDPDEPVHVQTLTNHERR